MRLPARFVADNLIWSTDGGVWAIWRVEAAAYPWLSAADKRRLHGRVTGALMALPPQSMWLSVCRRVDPYAVVKAMIEGVDLTSRPAWRQIAERTLEVLLGVESYDRLHFLCARLADEGWGRGLGATVAAAASQVTSGLGLPPPPVRRGELERRRRQAGDLGARLQANLPMRPARPGEIRWLYQRAPLRGVAEPLLEEAWEPPLRAFGEGEGGRLAGPRLESLSDVVFFEGGGDDDVERPRHRRYLRVNSEAGISYQTFLVVSDLPRKWMFPGGSGEWFVRADTAQWPVDWCARVTAVPNADAQARARKQARQLTAQVEEYEGEPSGPPSTLTEAMADVDEQRSQLAAASATPELHVTVVFSVAAERLGEVEQRAAWLRDLYETNEYGLPRPTGGQRALYQAMLPASPTPPVARDYTQHLLPADFASGTPVAGSRLGDPTGMLLGYTLDGGTGRPVLFDPAYGPTINKSGSLAVFGMLGSGKSYMIKQAAYGLLARGGQVVALDRTDTGEYVAFAQVAPARSQIVSLTPGGRVCLDPLRVFEGAERVRYALGFLTLLTGASPTDDDGATLREATAAVAAAGGGLGEVIGELQAMAPARPAAAGLARKLSTFAATSLAELAFGAGAPLTLDADYIVFHAPGLALPDREVMTNPHLARQLLPEQVFSMAALYLVAATARQVVFSDRRRFGAAVFDEAWALTHTLQGQQLLLELLRDGRKHFAGLWLLSQHPTDVGEAKLADLIEIRFVFRQSRGAAEAALRFAGVEATPHLVEVVSSDTPGSGLPTGQCLYRDVRGRVGRIEIAPALDSDLEEAFNTNPSARLEMVG